MALRPLLKFASRLPANVEPAFALWGQSNMLPWGSLAEGFGVAPHLTQGKTGLALTGVIVAAGTGTETITVGTALTASEWVGAELRLGTPAAPLVGYANVTANAAGTLTVTWVKDGTPATVDAYLVRRDARFAYYEMVRVLIPYQPDQTGPYPTSPPSLPGLTVPEGVDSYADLAAFLPFSFLEGIEGYGFSDSSGGGAATAAAATTFDFTTAVTAGIVAGGYVRVEHSTGVSWARVGDNTANQLTGLTKGDSDSAPGWSGAGTPTGTEATWKYEVWLPHYDNSPAHLLPGAGFRYPTNNLEPQGAVKNRPRGNTTSLYGVRFGMAIEFAYEMAVRIGRRVNLVLLGSGAAPLLALTTRSPAGYQGTWGWRDYTKHSSWSPSLPDGLAARLARMCTVIAPKALVAEGSTKRLRFLGLLGHQGETDSSSVLGIQLRIQTLSGFYTWLRKQIVDAGLSAYPADVKIPAVHNLLPNAVLAAFDTEGVTNQATTQWAALDGSAATYDTNDSPTLGVGDPHHNGIGEAINGFLAAEEMSELVDSALSQSDDPEAVDICNLALSHIGQGGITSLDPEDDSSTTAALCAQFYPVARDALLEMRNWSFALRRVDLTGKQLEASTSTAWDYAYGLPSDLLKALAVLPPGASDDYAVAVPQAVPQADSTGAIVTEPVMATPVPRQFQLEDDGHGSRILLTDQDEAILRYVARVVDTHEFPALFRTAVSWKLASLLAGPIIKKEQGAAEAERCLRQMAYYLAESSNQDVTQRQIKVQRTAESIRRRQ